MNQIELQKMIIPRDELDAVSYFNAFIQEIFRLHLISSDELERFQIQIIGLLSAQFSRYTSGFSSSVSEETAKRIQQSVLYSLGYYFKSLPDVEKGLQELKDNSLEALYDRGRKLVEMACVKAKELLKTVQENCLDTDVLAYRETLRDGLSIFFKDYDIDYGAHETPASIDYPLSCDKMILTGVDYILDYLDKIQIENNICSCYPLEEITSLLKGYDPEYRELLFNIFDLVLTNSVGALLLNRDEISLHLSDYDRRYLQQTLSHYPSGELGKPVDAAVSQLCRRLSVTDPLQLNYIKASAVKLKSRLQNAMESGTLDLLFLSIEDTAEDLMIQFEDKAKLDEDSFRRLADKIRECRLISDKLILLHRKPVSMTDLIDLLEGSCFFDDELLEVFRSLEEIQLALLVKTLPFDPDGSGFLDEESSREWQVILYRYLMQMEPSRKSAILKFAGRIESQSLK